MLLLIAPAAARAQFTCTTNGGAITITGYSGPGGVVVIPAAINGHPVTGITNETFTQTNITSVSVPASVTSIGSQVFAACFNLTAITVDPQNPIYSSRDGALFDKSQFTLLQYPEGLAGSYAVPGSVTTIATGALAECGGLTSLSIPGSVSTLLDLAICSCPNLGSVTIAGNVASLPNDLFTGCGSLTNVFFQGNAPTVAPPIYSGSPPIFYGLTNVTAYYLAGTTGWSNTFAGIPAVQLAATASAEFDFTTNAGAITITGYNCAGGLVIIPSAINGLPVTGIGANSFAFCTNLTGVAIPGSVTNIAGGAFEFCTGLADLIILPGAASIGDGAFEGCFNLSSVVIPGSVNSIGSSAFEGCVNLTGVVLLPGLTNIGDGAFEGCVSLSSLTVPGTVTSIGASAFESCASLNNVYFYGNAPTVGPGLFSNDPVPAVYYWPLAIGWGAAFAGFPAAPGLQETSPLLFNYQASGASATITGYTGPGGFVVIPTNINSLKVTAIGYNAFAGNTRLTSVVIPASVTSIAGNYSDGDYYNGGAFLNCYGLTNVTILGSPTIGEYAFYRNSQGSPMSVYLAGGSNGQFAFAWASVTNLTLGNGVTSIGVCAFIGASLSSLVIPPSVRTIGGNAFQGVGLTNVIFSYGIANIGSYSFNGNPLINLTLPGSLASVGNQAFFQCTLQNVIIDAGVTTFDSAVFESCPDLTNVLFLGNAPAFIDTGDGPVFYGDNNATAYYLPGTTGWSNTYQGIPTVQVTAPGEFTYTPNGAGMVITAYSGPGGAVVLPFAINGAPVTGIGANAFQNCTTLTSITIPGTLSTIGDGAFEGCVNLTSANIGAGVAKMGNDAFAGCVNLTNVNIGAVVTNIGNDAFEGCVSLGSILIPGSVAFIGTGAFDSCPALAAVYFQGNAPLVGPAVFNNDNLARVYYKPCLGGWGSSFAGAPTVLWEAGMFSFTTNGGTVTITGYSGSCDQLPIPSTLNGLPVTDIGSWVFEGCANLTSIVIPGSVTNIGNYAFLFCTNLSSVYFLGDAPAAGIAVLANDPGATAYYMAGRTGWSSTYQRIPAVLWNPLIQTKDGHFGVQNNQFGFNITGTTNIPIMVQACTNLANPVWTPLLNATLTNGSFHFSEPLQPNIPARYYRITSP